LRDIFADQGQIGKALDRNGGSGGGFSSRDSANMLGGGVDMADSKTGAATAFAGLSQTLGTTQRKS
jgi:hypothetical protein